MTASAFALALLLAGHAPAQESAPAWDDVVTASRRVEAILRNEEHLPMAEQVHALVKLGEPTIPTLFALRLGLPLPSAPAAAPDGDVEAAPSAAPGAESGAPPAAAIALAALRELPSAPVDAYLIEVAAHASDAHRPIDVVRLAGELARASSLDVIARVTNAMEPLLQVHPVVAGTLRQALVTILSNDLRAESGLTAFLMALPMPAAEPSLAAIASVKGRDRSALWCDLYGKRDGWDRALLDEIDRHPPIDATGFHRVGELLCENASSKIPAIRRQVAHLLRRHPELETAAVAIRMLEDEDDRVREVAYRSLLELAAINLPNDVSAWREWLDDEARWRSEQWLLTVKQALADAPDAQLLRLLASLARKRVHASVLAPAVGVFLENPRREIRLAACETLGRLATPDCIEQLNVARSDPDAAVRASAKRILSRLGAVP